MVDLAKIDELTFLTKVICHQFLPYCNDHILPLQVGLEVTCLVCRKLDATPEEAELIMRGLCAEHKVGEKITDEAAHTLASVLREYPNIPDI